MSSWGNNDNAANAPYWAVNSTIANTTDARKVAAPTAANVALLYGNTTPDVYTTNETIGLFNIDAQEISAQGHGLGAHAGWNLKTTGSGGRAGRVQHETLVVLANTISDGDGQVYANVSITLTGPSSTSVYSNTGFNNVATFTVSTTLTGNTNATLSYQWQFDNSGTWNNIPANTANIQYAGASGATLYARPADNTTANGEIYRVIVTAADEGVSVTSSNATLTIL